MFPTKLTIFKTSVKRVKYYAFLALVSLSFGILPINIKLAEATIPKYINFQGKLTAVSGGTNVANGTYAFEFKIYDALTSGSLLWTETFDQPSGSCGKLTVTNGVFNAKLGSCASLASVDFTTGALYLSVNFAPTGTSYDGEMSPRKQLVSSAFAFVANGVNGDGIINILNTGSNQATIGYDSSNKYTTNISSAGAITFDASGSSAGFTFSDAITSSALFTGNLGATISGAAVNLNASSNFAVNIASGTSTGAVTIGSATTTQAITIQSGTGDVNITSTDDFIFTATDDITINGGSAGSIIAIGANTNGNVINIGTDNTAADTISIGSALDNVAITGDDWSITNAGVLTVASCTGCSAGGGALDTLTAATTDDAALLNGDNTIAWHWALTSATSKGITLGESAASTGGSGDQHILKISTASGSTAGPLEIVSNSADSGDIEINLNSSGDFEIQDAGTAFATFSDSGQVGIQTAPTSDYLLSLSGTTGNDNSRIIDITQANDAAEDTNAININNTASPGSITSGSRTITNGSWTLAPHASLDQNSASTTSLNMYGLDQTLNFGSNAVSLGATNLGGNTTLNGYGNNTTLTGTPVIADDVANASSAILNFAGNNASVGVTVNYSVVNSAAEATNIYGGKFNNTSTKSGSNTIGTLNSYGLYADATGDLGTFGVTTRYGARFAATGTADNNYGIYVDSVTGATNNYAAIFAGGSVGIGTTAPDKVLEVNAASGGAIRLTYNDSNGSAATYSDLSVTSGGLLNLQASGNGVTLGGGSTATDIRFLEPSGGGTDYAAIKAGSVTTSYTWTLPAADASGCIQSNGSGTLSIGSCGGGALTPWTSAIDADGFALQDALNLEFRTAAGSAPAGSVIALYADNSGDLTANVLTGKTYNVAVNGTDEYNFSSTALAMNSNNITGLGTALTATAGLTVTATGADLALVTATSGNITLAPASTGSVQITSGATTGTTTTSALSLVANSLSTGTGVNVSSTSLTSGTLLNLSSNGTAAAASQTGLNISMQGTNGTSGITSYGAQVSNTHDGTTSTNVALQLAASGGTTANYALITNGGNVGIGDTSPAALLTVGNGDLIQLTSAGKITQSPTSFTTTADTGLTQTIAISGSSTSQSYYGTKIAVTNSQTTNANTVYGLDIALSGSGSLANTLYGININAATSNTADTTTSISLTNTVNTSGATAVAGILGTYTMTNSTASGFEFGNRFVSTISSTTAGTHVGDFIRMADNTVLDSGQVVRGLEVQAYSGTNNNGTNTGIASFGKTFGVQGTTTAQAAAQAQPAAIFADLDNGTDSTTKARGNAIRAYTNDATSADLVSFYQETSAYTGNGLIMNFGNNSGSFTGNFLELQVAGSSKATITSAGRIGVLDSSPDYSIEVSAPTSSDSSFALSDGDVAHGLTALGETDAYMLMRPISSTAGGLKLEAFSDTDASALNMYGYMGSTDPTDTTPAIKFIGAKKSTTDVQDLAAAETIFQVANNDNTASLSILGDNKVGIGVAAPTYDLDVQKAQNTFTIARVYNSSSGSSASARFVLGNDTASATGQMILSSSTETTFGGANSLNFYNGQNAPIAFFTNGVNQRFSITGTGNVVMGTGAIATNATDGFFYMITSAGAPSGTPTTNTGRVAMEYDTTNNKLCAYNAAWKCSGAFADVAEWAPAADTESGDVVAITSEPNPTDDPSAPFMLGKAGSAYSSSIVGVISKYAEDAHMANGYPLSPDYHALTLAGRVPVKISNENGNIYPGDFLTASATKPGFAMKATKAGTVIGQALQSFDGSCQNNQPESTQKQNCMIMIFVNVGYHAPSVSELLQNPQDNSDDQLLNALVDLNMTDAAVFGDIAVGGNLYVQKDLQVKGSIIAATMEADTITAKQKLCVGNTCVTEEQLQSVLQLLNQPPSQPSPAPNNNEDTPSAPPEDLPAE